jgi:SAM-dependent methyltransferase
MRAPTDPYAALARIYDRTMGRAGFAQLMSTMRRARSRFGFALDRVADLGCGTGLFLEALYRPGRQLIGVDRSPAMLARARARLGRRPVTLLCQDMRQLHLPHTVGLVTCNFQTLNYLTRKKDIIALLEKVSEYLTFKGWFLCDILTGEGFSNARHQPAVTVRADGLSACFRVQLAPARRMHSVGIEIVDHRDGSTVAETHRQRWYAPGEIGALLARCGFAWRAYPVGQRGCGAAAPAHWVQIAACRRRA